LDSNGVFKLVPVLRMTGYSNTIIYFSLRYHSMRLLKNRFVAAVVILVLLSAAVHLVLQAAYAISHFDFSSISIFRIIGVDLYFPHLTSGTISHIISILITVCAYLIIFFFLTLYKARSIAKT
jgi:hypothetical protein